MSLDTCLNRLMAAAAVPGMALAVIDRGQISVIPMGVTALDGTSAVGATTVFDVASLSKPVAAYMALQLADTGLLALDRPVSEIVSKGVPPQLAAQPITARHLLTHTSGLPNLRGNEPLQTFFAPGSWFSYSSVGFSYLQLALEAVAGEPLETLAQRLVFTPLGMRSTSFVWHDRFGADVAMPHEGEKREEKHRPTAAQASYSLQTTAGDYANFMITVLNGTSLSESTKLQWLPPAVMVPRGDATHLASTVPEVEQGIGWGLGWGVETTTGCFFQWGNGGRQVFSHGQYSDALGAPSNSQASIFLTVAGLSQEANQPTF